MTATSRCPDSNLEWSQELCDQDVASIDLMTDVSTISLWVKASNLNNPDSVGHGSKHESECRN